MHHPGPPRFAAVGDSIELAPRDPVPEAQYSWRIARAPIGSTVELGDDPVEHLTPDTPGTYVAELTAPDGVHDLTIRVFPGDARSRSRPAGPDDYPAHHSGARVESDSVDDHADGGGSYDARWIGAEESGNGGRPRVRLDARVEGDELLVEADVRPHPDAEPPVDLSAEFVIDDRDDLSAEAIEEESDEHGLRIPVERLPDRLRVHGVAVGDRGYSVADAVDVRRDGGESGAPVEVIRPYDPPEWAKDAVIYEIYVRSFADGTGADSTFDAIADQFDYLESLGVDVLWLTPILENDHAPHGYNITDFFSIASDLGTREDFERFVDRAHDRGMKVLFDLVLNHSARTHPYFQEALADPDSEYHDWYEWQAPGEPGTYFDWEHIANFEFDTLAVRRHLLDAVDEWFPSVDGFRCDMAWAVPNAFWKELRDRVKARNPEFLLLDETIPYIADFQEGMFDMHFDSTTAFTLREVGSGSLPATAVLDAVEERTATGFPDHASFMLYHENHDESRYVVECDEPSALAAGGALFTLPGAPMIYAGQELGQRGRRDALAWDHARTDFRDHYERLVEARHAQPALRYDAALERIDYAVQDGDEDAVVAYARVADVHDDRFADSHVGDDGLAEPTALVVVLNFGEDTATVTVGPEIEGEDLFSGAEPEADGTIRVDSVALVPVSTGSR